MFNHDPCRLRRWIPVLAVVVMTAGRAASLPTAEPPAAGSPSASDPAGWQPPSRAVLYGGHQGGFGRRDWGAARAAAKADLEVTERDNRVPVPAHVTALLNLASVEAESGDFGSAQEHVKRAAGLVEGLTAPEPASRFSVAIIAAKIDIRAGRFKDGVERCHRALGEAGSTAAVDGELRSEAYALLIDGARGLADGKLGNAAAADLLAAGERYLDATPVRRMPGIYAAAGWYHWSSQLSRERKLLENALAILEQAYGPRDSRLAYPLRTLGMSYIVGQTGADKAKIALLRALALDFADGTDTAAEKSQIHAGLGDHDVVFGDPAASGEHYATAWQSLARDPAIGTQTANAVYAAPIPLHVDIPAEPFRGAKGGGHFTAGDVDLAFTVTGTGQVKDLRLADRNIPNDSVPTPVVQAFRLARYRPRILDGKPVDTPDQQFRMTFRVSN